MQRPRGSLYAFDLLKHDGTDLRDLPLLERKQGLARLLGRAKRQVIHFKEDLADDGPKVFKHVCWMGLEGIVSKRIDAPYRSGPSRTWLKSKTRQARRCAGNVRKSGAEPAQREGNARAQTHGAWRVAQLCKHIYPDAAIEMKHRVAVTARCARWCCHVGCAEALATRQRVVPL